MVAVRAWRMPNPQATPSGTPAGRISRAGEVEEEARAALERDVAATLGEDHGAELRLVRGSKYNVLLKAAEDADLLVVDAPRQLLAGPMFAHRLVYAATCPVVVMPPVISGEPPSVLSRVAGAVGRNVLAAAGPPVAPATSGRSAARAALTRSTPPGRPGQRPRSNQAPARNAFRRAARRASPYASNVLAAVVDQLNREAWAAAFAPSRARSSGWSSISARASAQSSRS